MNRTGIKVFIDMETVPDQREGAASAALARVTVPSNYKDPEKIKAYREEKGSEAWRKTSLDGGYGQIFCIGFAVDDQPVIVIDVDNYSREAEAELLREFWRLLDPLIVSNPVWIGHNVLGFDLPFLWRRSVILGVAPMRPIPYNAAPWGHEVNDTMIMWCGQRNAYISLDELLSILGIPSDDIISGSEVWDVLQGTDGVNLVMQHCYANVSETREAWRRMRIA
jgi:hypothetical protein